MALVRCKQCGAPRGRTRSYTISVEPVGYPDTAVVCGASGCERPGLVWLEQQERMAYNRGQRVFELPTAATKVKVK